MAEHPDVTLVKRGYAAFNSGDMATLAELVAEDATQHMVGDNLLSGEHKGRNAIFAMYARLGELTNGTYRDGRELDNRQALIFTILDGSIVDLQPTSADVAVDDAFYQ